VTTDDTNPFEKKFKFLPKTVEISQLKVMRENEEMTAEQMMVQSMVNIQFEQAKKMFKEIPLNIGDIMKKNPRELQCLGFNLVDLDVSFRKS
jgi:thiaminase